jgi:hypothetical protein
VNGWANLILDSAGYDMISQKTDQIRAVQASMEAMAIAPAHIAAMEIPAILESRNVDGQKSNQLSVTACGEGLEFSRTRTFSTKVKTRKASTAFAPSLYAPFVKTTRCAFR